MTYRLMIEFDPKRDLNDLELDTLLKMVRLQIEEPLVENIDPELLQPYVDADWSVDELKLEIYKIAHEHYGVTKKKSRAEASA